ncbi:MAG: TspO/MBR family protein [Lishizhenia sp.]
MPTHIEQHKTSFFKASLWIKVVISVILIEILGALPTFTSMDSLLSWYPTLNKPFFNPPNWIFGPAWTTLFLLMGISFGRFWHTYLNETNILKRKRNRTALYLFILHMGLNMLWTHLFFGMQQPFYALTEIIILWSVILFLIILFWRINRWSAILLIPYILWVSFATLLNAAIVYLN